MEFSSRAAASNGPLWKALLISAAVHLLVLFAVVLAPQSEFGEPEGATRHLQIHRFSTSRPAEAAASKVGAAVNRQPVRQFPVLSTAVAAAEPAPSITVGPPPPTASVDRNKVPPVAHDAAASASVPVVLPATSPAELSGEPELPEGYADALRGYRVALALHAKRFRLYPPAAQEMGLGGRSEVEVVLLVAAAPEVRIKKTSGHDVLDQAALEMLRRSVRGVELPVQLKGRRLIVALPVEFVPPR